MGAVDYVPVRSFGGAAREVRSSPSSYRKTRHRAAERRAGERVAGRTADLEASTAR